MSISSGQPAYQRPPVANDMQMVATTDLAGYVFTTGGGNVLTWTAPNDGQMHRVELFGGTHCTAAATGGALHFNFQSPDGSNNTPIILGANQATGWHFTNNAIALVAPGTTVTISQDAQSAGAQTGWFELWAS